MPKSTKPRLRDRLGIGSTSGRSSRATSPLPPPPALSTPPIAQPLSVLPVGGGPPTSAGYENPAFADALNLHIQEISPAERQAFQDSDTVTAHSLLERLREHDETHCSKSYQRKCAPGVAKFLTALKTYMGPVTTMIGHSPEISSLVMGGFKLIVDLGLKLVNFFDRLTAMMEFLSVHLDYLGKYAEAFPDSDEVQRALSLTYRDLLQFFTKARNVFVDKEGKLKGWVSFRIFWRVSWEDFEGQYQQLSSQFSNHSMTVVRMANAKEFERIRNKEKIEEFKEADKKRRELLLWLSDLDFDHDHDRIFSARHGDSGTWLVESQEFTGWHESDASAILWCHGTPGVGKSVLTSIVLENISAKHCSNDRVGLAFFYFDFQRQERQTPAKVLGTFLKQLARQKQRLPDHLKLFYQQYYKDALFPDEQKLEAQLIELSKSFERLFLIIDAMDEYDERKSTLAMLTRLAQNGSAIFKIFLTSRKEKDINRAFEKFPTIQVEARTVDTDIRKYIRDQMLHRVPEAPIDEHLKAEITKTLISQSNGMFLWVKFQLDNIYSQPTARDIRKALKSLPEDIDATYNRILEKINKQGATERKVAQRALCWVAGAARPLNCLELSTAVSIESDDNCYEDIELYNIEWIVGVCGNLIIYDALGTIRPVHMTVVEFMKQFDIDGDDSRTPNNLRRYKFPKEMHATLAKQCLEFISFANVHFRSGFNVGHRSIINPGNSFLNYCSNYWVFHYRELDNIPVFLSDAINRFLTSPKHPFHLAYLNSYPGLRWDDYYYSQDIITPAEFCVDLDLLNLYFSIFPFDQKLLTEEPHLLCLAAGSGYIVSTQILLDFGFDINHQMADGSTALLLALSGRYEEAATILLSRGANANLQNTLPNAVYENSSIKLFKLLVSKGADPVAQQENDKNVLQIAAQKGRDDIVEFLLDEGMHPDARSRFSSTALILAMSARHWSTVRLLLSRGADPTQQGGKYGSPLGAAALWGSLDVAKLLLEYGADPTQQGGKYGSPLGVAAYGGCLDIVKLLLELGADPNTQSTKYGSALIAAVLQGAEMIVIMLLDQGVDIDYQGGFYHSTIIASVIYALRWEKEEILSLLLDRGADIYSQCGQNGNDLLAAINSRHSKDRVLRRGLYIQGLRSMGLFNERRLQKLVKERVHWEYYESDSDDNTEDGDEPKLGSDTDMVVSDTGDVEMEL